MKAALVLSPVVSICGTVYCYTLVCRRRCQRNAQPLHFSICHCTPADGQSISLYLRLFKQSRSDTSLWTVRMKRKKKENGNKPPEETEKINLPKK
jgi:hypothetical protein